VTPAEILIAKQRRQLMRVERNGMSEMVRAYQAVLKRMYADLDALNARIDAARAAGDEVSRAWLARQDRYRTLIDQLEQHTLAYLDQALTTTAALKGQAVDLALSHAPKLAVAQMGAAPRAAQASVEGAFDRLASRQLDEILRNSADGRPLGRLFHRIAPDTVQAARDSLANGIAQGHGPRRVAHDLRRATNLTVNRSLTIARTEMIGAYRQTASEMYRKSSVVDGWTWHADLSGRTCPACLAMHGTRHATDETLDSHLNCRCTMLPETKRWADLGFDIPDGRQPIQTGAERLAAMGEADQLAILGRRRLDAYNAGEITLDDLVRTTRHQEWGTGRRAATLTEIGLA
jgi:SPP1 gp7 family putative phage head morphogenesis protein